jgi:hypothetical protein
MYNNSDVDTQMTPYDYGSVMHYERNAFAINSSVPTIIPVMNSSAFLGQRVQLSPIDIIEIQRMYGCVATPTSTTTASTPAMTSTATTITTTGTPMGNTTIRTTTTTMTTVSTNSSSGGSTSTSTQTASGPSASRNAAVQHAGTDAIYATLVLCIVHFTL